MLDAYIYKGGKKTLVESSDLTEMQTDIATVKTKIGRIAPHQIVQQTFELYGHQGVASNSKHIPGNTLPAFWEALKEGFDGMETDCRKTSDGVWVLSHNDSISGTVSGESTTMEIATHTLAELKTVLLDTSTDYGDTYIATLEEVLTAANYTGMKMLLEWKGGTDPAGIAECVMMTGMQGRVTYMLNHSNWAEIAAVDKNASFAEVIFGFGSIADFTTYTPFLTGSNTVSLDYRATSSETPDTTNIKAAQKAGLTIDFWGINGGNFAQHAGLNPKHMTWTGIGTPQAALASYLADVQATMPGYDE